MTREILVLNAGSSSIKFAVFGGPGYGRRILQGLIAGLGSRPAFSARDDRGPVEARLPASLQDHEAALAWLFGWLEDAGHAGDLAAAGHRVVHGGTDHAAPVLIGPQTMASLRALAPLAPLHQPHNLAAIAALARLRPELPQIACFDTAFHRSQLPVAQQFALPREYAARGLRRYGFHGLSYEYVAGRLPAVLGARGEGRVIVAHLGNGASLCALYERRSVATSMGFSTLEGLVMGTRCGSIDPGVLLHLLREQSMPPDELEDLLYRRSGLLGVSGLSNDMRTLLGSSDPRAAEAIELFVYRAAQEIAALAVPLQGLDALVFTGGIGENAAPVRAMICARLGWLGLTLDAEANAGNAACISKPGPASAHVIATDEEAVIAAHTARLIAQER
jgi:acetate kinase